MTLPAFAAERRAAALLLLDTRRQLSIDITCPPGAEHMPLLLSNSGTVRRTDRRSTVS